MAAEVEPEREEVPFPRVDLTQTLTVSTVRLAFGNDQDARMFHRWITKGGGWAAFGTYVDERRG